MDFRSLMPFSGGRAAAAPGNGNLDPFSALHREMDRLFDDFQRGFGAPSRLLGAFPWNPSLDVRETDKAYEVTLELPGVEEKDVQVDLADGVLTVKGEKKVEKTDGDKARHVAERAYGAFQRTLSVPADVDEAGVAATYAKGVLTVTLPKSPDAKPRQRRIEVRAG